MNAETSGWGRAIASQGIAVHRGIASAQEVRAAQRGTDVPKVTRVATTEDDNGWYGPPVDKTPHVDQGPIGAVNVRLLVGEIGVVGLVSHFLGL